MKLTRVDYKCKRLSKICVYPARPSHPDPSLIPNSSISSHETALSSNKVKGSEEFTASFSIPIPGLLLESGATSRTRSSAPFFLDPESYVPGFINGNTSISVPLETLGLFGSKSVIQTLCDSYFRTTQTWLPILSQKQLLQNIDRLDDSISPELSLLLLCMQLISGLPADSALSPLYFATKSFYSRIEASSLISLQLLQCITLIALYEVSHGIYPAAYLSTGHAARLGMMMGLHDTRNARHFFRKADTWTGCEEERRTWWAVIILDR